MTLAIDLLYPIERPLAADDFEAGAGASENLVILLSRALAGRGHAVTVYCRARRPGPCDGVRWRQLEEWDRCAPHDLTISFRATEPLMGPVASRLRAVLLADRRQPGLRAALELGSIDLVVAVSAFQAEEVARAEGIERDGRWVVLPSFATRLQDYGGPVPPREAGLCHYASAPYRGLPRLLDLWPRIRARAPHAHLVVASSYLHWGRSPEENEALTRDLYRRMDGQAALGVTNAVRLGRRDLVSLQLRSELMLYPADYDETFCVAALEAAAAGAVVVATRRGALAERVVHEVTGVLVDPAAPDRDERFVERAVHLLTNREERERLGAAARRLASTSGYDRVAQAWERLWRSSVA